MASNRHRILVLEDDPDTSQFIQELLRGEGFEVLAVRSLEEFRECLRNESFCAYIGDLEVPATRQSIKGDPECGLIAVKEFRVVYPRTNEFGRHLVPAICMSTFAKDHRTGRKALKAAFDDVVVKPFSDNDESLLDTLRRLLKEAGRDDHGDCAEITARARRDGSVPPPAPADHRTNHVVISGIVLKKNGNELTVNGRTVSMTNAGFQPLILLVEGRLSGVEWVAGSALGKKAGEGFRGVSVMAKELSPYLLPGTRLYRTKYKVGYCLTDDIVIDRIDGDTLAKHDVDKIRRAGIAIAKLQKPAKARR